MKFVVEPVKGRNCVVVFEKLVVEGLKLVMAPVALEFQNGLKVVLLFPPWFIPLKDGVIFGLHWLLPVVLLKLLLF